MQKGNQHMKTGEIIKQKRQSFGWTQKKLAERLEMFQTDICAMENGRKKPSFRIVKRMAEVFDCEVSELLGDDGAKPSKAADSDEKISLLNQAIIRKNEKIKDLEQNIEVLKAHNKQLIDTMNEYIGFREENDKLRKILFEKLLAEELAK